jgi:hypothetical protein
MAAKFVVRRNLGGGQPPEKYGPFDDLNEAVARACALLEKYGQAAPVFVENTDGTGAMDYADLRTRCAQISSPPQSN